MDKFTLPVLKYELRKRQLDSKGVKAVLRQRLRVALDEEGQDPTSYETDFGRDIQKQVSAREQDIGQASAREQNAEHAPAEEQVWGQGPHEDRDRDQDLVVERAPVGEEVLERAPARDRGRDPVLERSPARDQVLGRAPTEDQDRDHVLGWSPARDQGRDQDLERLPVGDQGLDQVRPRVPAGDQGRQVLRQAPARDRDQDWILGRARSGEQVLGRAPDQVLMQPSAEEQYLRYVPTRDRVLGGTPARDGAFEDASFRERVLGQAAAHVQGLERAPDEDVDVGPGDSVSQVGKDGASHISRASRRSRRSCSSTRSGASMRVAEAAKKAELAARASLLREKRELEERELKMAERELRMKLKMRQEKEEFALRTEMTESDARLRAIVREEALICGDEVQSESWPQHKGFDQGLDADSPRDRATADARTGPTSSGGPAEQTHGDDGAVRALLAQHSLPKIELQKFDGRVADFIPFMKKFDEIIGARTSDDRTKFHYLEQYTTGEPREVVKGCQMLPASCGYKRARELLNRRYGDERRMTAVLMEELLAWPLIKSDDVHGLDRFAVFLTRCGSVSVGSASEMDQPNVIRIVMQKLPYPLQDRLRRLMVDIQDTGRHVVFQDVVRFVDEETRIALNPLYGKQVVQPQKSGPSGTPSKKQVGHSCLATGVVEQEKLKCWCCEGEHRLDDCEALRKKNADEKRLFMMKHRLCFGCLRRGHRVDACRTRKTCQACSGLHPTVLHDDTVMSGRGAETPQAPEVVDIVAGASKLQSGMSIIPVRVRVGGKTVSTYAFLDNGSSATFCTQGLLSSLEVKDAQSARLALCTVDPDMTRLDSHIVIGMQVSDMSESQFIDLPPVYTLQKIPVTHDDIPTRQDLDAWPHLQSIDLQDIDAEIGLMIGNNVPEAMEPWSVVHGRPGEPFAVETKLGWVVNGPVKPTKSGTIKVNRVKIDDVDVHQMFVNMYNEEFEESSSLEGKGMSREDHLWQERVESSCTRLDSGHFEIGLPFKDAEPVLPNNRHMAVQRLASLKRKLGTDNHLHHDYTVFMDDMLENGYAEEVPENDVRKEGKTWYIPHHAVRHPQKPDKVRVVFDCAAKFHGLSLNSMLLQGPDLTSNLTEVLMRFRTGPQAFMADIEAMFYQVSVPEQDRDFLRFLWWPRGDLAAIPREYRMTVHLFGATSSPSCANYALRKTADDFGRKFDEKVGQCVKTNFYVDDCLRSEDSEEECLNMAQDLKTLCSMGGFNLTKFVSTSRNVLKSLPPEERGKEVKTMDLTRDELPLKRALGVCWRMDSDVFSFNTFPIDKPFTKRGILSTVGSVYDPLGMAAPFVLGGRMILQNLCRLQLDWDEDIPVDQERLWKAWLSEFPDLSRVELDRCYVPGGFGKVVSCQLHLFSDASEVGFGVASYLRLTDDHGKVHCSFVFGKAKVAPLKVVTIPRLELMGAVTAVRINRKVERALDFPISETVFWTDSITVLSYIENRHTRFHTFVANRLETIHDGSVPSQWRYVSSAQNPADDASRGRQTRRWLEGPEFLWKDPSEWPGRPKMREIGDDPEVKQVACNVVQVSSDSEAGQDTKTRESRECPIAKLGEHYSSWYRMKKAVAWLMRLKNLLRCRISTVGNMKSLPKRLTPEELDNAEKVIVEATQRRAFADEIVALKRDSRVKRSSRLAKLDPKLHDNIIRVGGRLDSACLSFNARHPVILPQKDRITRLIIEDMHQQVGHQGREHVLAHLREKFWVLKGASAVRKVVNSCFQCRRKHAAPMVQKMSQLPEHRTKSDDPPFTNTGVDLFGPFFTKRGRAQVKVYGVIFTCLASRAVHLEVADSLSTDSFINSLRRFIARRGHVKTIRSDRGTNFVGADRELKEAIKQWNENQVSEALLQRNIQWIFNPPHASHFGGIWERQIRTVRKVLNSILNEQSLTYDSITTLFCEVEAIINSRPLTCISDDPNDMEPLTPNHLLQQRGGVPLPPGVFSAAESQSRRRWKQVQYLSDLFWRRWKKEYLPLQQGRSKWQNTSENLSVGDIVVIVEDTAPRCQWHLGRVMEASAGSDGLVRRVKVRTNGTIVERPITRLVLLSKDV